MSSCGDGADGADGADGVDGTLRGVWLKSFSEALLLPLDVVASTETNQSISI